MKELENEKDSLLKQKETALKQAEQTINEQADEIERLRAKLKQAEDANILLQALNEELIKVQVQKEEQQALDQSKQRTMNNIQEEKLELENQENLNQIQPVFEIQPKLKELLNIIKERYYGAYSDYASNILKLSEEKSRSSIMDNRIMENLRYLEKVDLVYLDFAEQQQFKEQLKVFRKDIRVQIFSVSQKFQKQIDIFKEDLRALMIFLSQELDH